MSMTRERIIQILKMSEQEKWRSGITVEEEKEAVDMAIEALKETERNPTITSWYDFDRGYEKGSESTRQHGECKTCKYYAHYMAQFSYKPRGDGYCKRAVTTSEGEAYMNCHDEWYCANYEKEGEWE